jgi:hypothetical protein
VTVELGRTRRSRLAELRRDLGQRAIAPTGFFMIGKRRLVRAGIAPTRTAGEDAQVHTKLRGHEPTYH